MLTIQYSLFNILPMSLGIERYLGLQKSLTEANKMVYGNFLGIVPPDVLYRRPVNNHDRVRAFLETIPVPVNKKHNRSTSSIPEDLVIDIFSKNRIQEASDDYEKSEKEISYSLLGEFGYVGNIAIGFANRLKPQNKRELDLKLVHKGKDRRFIERQIETYNTGWVNIYKYDTRTTPAHNLQLIKDDRIDKIAISINDIRKLFAIYLPKTFNSSGRDSNVIKNLLFKMFELENIVNDVECEKSEIEGMIYSFLKNFKNIQRSGGYHYINKFFKELDIQTIDNHQL